MASSAALGAPSDASCFSLLTLEKPALRDRLVTLGTNPAQTTFAITHGHEWLIEARERGNDAILEVRDPVGRLLAQADHPERRTGTRRVIISPRETQMLSLRVAGKEHAAVIGSVELVVFDLAVLAPYPACLQALHALAAGDADYAAAQQISLGHIDTPTQTAREAYLRAADEYLAAESLLRHPGDESLRAEAALAVAGVRYFDLQDWRLSAEWAGTAGRLFVHRDPYRRARARALTAAAWIEMATDATPSATAAGHGSDPRRLLAKSRRMLRQLFYFHRDRQERYDAALQINNVGLAYMYEARFLDCVAAARWASGLFAELGETPRQGLARQNQALCYWGLGHLPQALRACDRALEDLGPEPYPQLYVLALNNTALINYALGHFDESLRLHDRALALATRIQNRRAQAQSLYGIGVTYYALGDRRLAQQFLERSLALRTAAFDGRGRRATLRSLATVYADLGKYGQAIQFDHEALTLATASSSRARSGIALAIHTALDGNPSAALQTLGEIILPGTLADPLIVAQARLERAVIERRAGAYDAALRDLGSAIPIFKRFGSVTDGFSADLEHARVLRLAGLGPAALAAVDAALDRSEAIRTQTANPEFRAQLQLPLRAAYDLKLELLWQTFDSAVKGGREREAAGIAELAFRSADGARARSFADIAAQQYSPAIRRDISGDLARREVLYRNLAGLRFALDARLDHAGSRDSRAREFEGEIAGLEREVDTLNNAIAARTAGAATARGGTRVAPMMAIPQDTAIIAYWLGTQAAYSWTATPAGIHWIRLSDPRTVTAAARSFHDALEGLADVSRERRIDTSAALYAQILRPVYEWIAPYKQWLFIPDSALDYVPFAALRADSGTRSRYIVTAHDIALAPAFWVLLIPPHRNGSVPSPSPSRILLVADPVYEPSDPRLESTRTRDRTPGTEATRAVSSLDLHQTYQRIPGTAREAAAIQALFPAAAVDALSGPQATRARLLQLDWSRYRFIHIASHGYLDAQMPQLSSLVLSAYDQLGQPIEAELRTADLSALTLDADVAVFSGCDTALGNDVPDEGVVGIAYAALARGARAVIASLWQVPDESSARFMTELYQHLTRDSMSPVTALSTSMRSVIDRNPAADPALWAAFQVSVETL